MSQWLVAPAVQVQIAHIAVIGLILLEQNATISAKDLDLIHVVDTADEAVAIMDDFYSNYLLKPNF